MWIDRTHLNWGKHRKQESLRMGLSLLPVPLPASRIICRAVSVSPSCVCAAAPVWLAFFRLRCFLCLLSLSLTLCFTLLQSCVFSLWLSHLWKVSATFVILQHPRQCRGSQEEKKPAPHPMEFSLFLAFSVPIPCRTSLLTRRCRDSPTDILLCQTWRWTWLWDLLHEPSSLYVTPDHVH